MACSTIVEPSQQEGFYRVLLPAAGQTPNLEDQWLERSNSRHKAPPASETTQANPSSGRWNYGREMAKNCAENGDFHVTFWVLLHAVILRHETDGFTSSPKGGAPPEKSDDFGRVWTRELGYQRSAHYLQTTEAAKCFTYVADFLKISSPKHSNSVLFFVCQSIVGVTLYVYCLLLVAADYYRLWSIMFTVYHRKLSIPVVTHVTHSVTYHYQYCLCVCRSTEGLNSVKITAQMCCETHLKCMKCSTLNHWCRLWATLTRSCTRAWDSRGSFRHALML